MQSVRWVGLDMMIPSDHVQGPPCPFRAVGFTWQAGLYPLSPAAQAIVAEHNGVPVEKLPRGARNAPNPHMQQWLERLGARRIAGLQYRHDGRWMLVMELGDGWENPVLDKAYPDEDCGCPVEEWIYHGIGLLLHFEADGSVEVFADGGDWTQDVPLTATTLEVARGEAFAWVDALPSEEEYADSVAEVATE